MGAEQSESRVFEAETGDGASGRAYARGENEPGVKYAPIWVGTAQPMIHPISAEVGGELLPLSLSRR